MGRFIVIEGMDGSGKTTQTKMLTDFFNRNGYSVKSFHFPSGKGFYGERVNEFLRGEYGNAKEVDPYFAAFVFAGDRKEMAQQVRTWLEEYDVLLLDRYVLSNIAYQCAKISDKLQQKKLREWILDLEFKMFDIPRPDVSMFLDVPLSFVGHQLEQERTGEDRVYLEGSTDIHEEDIRLQREVGAQYRILCEEYAETLRVECTDSEDGSMLDSESVHRNIIELLKQNGVI